MVRGQWVRYGWIPVIESAREVLHEEQRILRLFAETPIGVSFFVRSEKLCGWQCSPVGRQVQKRVYGLA